MLHVLFADVTGTDLFKWISSGGIVGILAFILVGGSKGWWVFGWQYKDALDRVKQAERERDEIINHPVSYHGEVKILNLITKETITTICKTELIYHKKELIGTIGRLYVIS